ncbi:MAG TPA: cytochrome C oxidase subunit IV family protein [Thermoanaerobaculia bacterium]|nr:cytochrome C oxidase subunit IV family protein [Thermoanaerobaculia bacterium]HUM30104.1 cytochrome C oxidase subunit IV family protein [Thermoanaerobaculia bacterium]HXK68801.1 cytochrome C oxidase subunit IV family protein [Thermoanaerobaculia bacterium]
MEKQETLSYGTYIMVWLALLVFTGLTVTAAGLHLGSVSIATAIAIAALKSTIVLFFFMHLKYDDPVFKVMLMVAILTLTVIMVLTFVDVLFLPGGPAQ